MIGQIELLLSFLAGTLLFIIGLGIIKRTRSDKLPNGSVVIDKINSNASMLIPGNKLSHLGVTVPVILNKSLEIIVMIICALNFWMPTARIISINLPYLLNWIGIFGIFACLGWAFSVFLYNVNFSRLYKPLKGKYVLATGGPYKLMRHPGYVEAMFEMICFFLVTGIWFISILFIIFIIALPYQARGEEKVLLEIFGQKYQEYQSQTAKFFPKLI